MSRYRIEVEPLGGSSDAWEVHLYLEGIREPGVAVVAPDSDELETAMTHVVSAIQADAENRRHDSA